MILCPSELVKCRLQVQASQKAPNVSCLQSYEGPFDCVRKTIANDGIRGMFKGGLTTLLRECVGNSFFFTTYEFSRYYLMSAYGFSQETLSKESEIGLSESSLNQKYSRAAFEGLVDIFSGGLAGMVFWVAVLPLDVVKTRVQTAVDPKASRNPLYNLKLICKRVGLKGLYTGLGPTLVRAFPANAAAMLTWELTAKFLGVRRYDKQTLDCV